MLPNPPSSTASPAGRPVITASVPTSPASPRNPATAPGCARASRGSAPLSPRGPALGARAHPVAAGTLPAQPLDQNGVEPERFRPVDELVQQLVVASPGEPEEVGDRLLLGTRLPPPAPLEGQDAHVALG